MSAHSLLRVALSLVAIAGLLTPPVAHANALQGVRFGVDSDRTRIVFDLSEPARYVAAIESDDQRLLKIAIDQLEPRDIAPDVPVGLVTAIHETAPGVFAMTLSAPAKISAAFVLAPGDRVKQYRLVIDLERSPARWAAPRNGRGLAENAAPRPTAPGQTEAVAPAESASPAERRSASAAHPAAGKSSLRPLFFFSEDGATIAVGDSGVELNLGGRLHADAVSYSQSRTQMNNDAALRRARLALSIRLGERFRAKVERDFSKVSAGWKNLWGEFKIADGLRLKAGSHVAPFSLEAIESSNNIVFMERSLASALAPDFLTGVSLVKYGRHYSVTGGYFGNALSTDSDVVIDDGRSVIARVTIAPVNRPGAVVHFGAAAERRQIHDDAMSRVRSKPEISIGARRLIDTRMIANVDGFTSVGAEFGAQYRALNFQAQYIHREYDSRPLGDPSFDGAYAELSWAITGEARGYSESSGAFTDIRPSARLGALEAAARVSVLDISDGPISGGEEVNYSLGLNWYFTDNARLMLNLIHADARPNRNGDDESVNIAGLRTQVDF